MEVTLIDSPFANVANIRSALQAVGSEVTLTRDPVRIGSASKLVLPGVGSFAAAMRWLGESGVAEALNAAVTRGSTLLGICVGHQMLFEQSEEDGLSAGLGFLTGTASRFSDALPVPQIGWNRVQIAAGAAPLFDGIADGTPFYYVNSYRVADAASQIASSDYGGHFAAAVRKGRIIGVQFHPERSSTAGLRLLKNFMELS